MICPGGGYWNLYWQLEGEEVAEWLNSIGVTGIILKYPFRGRPDEPEKEPARRPLQDAQRAVSLVRSKAAEFKLRSRSHWHYPGFSAGGHLALAAATSFEKRTYKPIDSLMKSVAVRILPSRFIPVTCGPRRKTNSRRPFKSQKGTPPIFLVHGGEDIISPPENSVLMYLALKKAGVSCDYTSMPMQLTILVFERLIIPAPPGRSRARHGCDHRSSFLRQNRHSRLQRKLRGPSRIPLPPGVAFIPSANSDELNPGG